MDAKRAKAAPAGTPREVTAECLCIGDELLIGQTINTNAAWIGEKLGLWGIRPMRTRVVADDERAIVEALGDAVCDVVLITGGLGPTKDDITKHCLCRFFNTGLVRNAEVEARLRLRYMKAGRDPDLMLALNSSQAMLPARCTVLPNDQGTASGMWFEQGGRVFVSLPGVPFEMQHLMEERVLPRLRRHFSPPTIIHRTVRTAGIWESLLAERLADWEAGLARNKIHLAYLPSPGQVKLRLSRYANADQGRAQDLIDREVEALHALVPEFIYGEGEDEIQQVIGAQLAAMGQTVATAESCTGGTISQLITAVPGSSAYFKGAVVAYSNEAKEHLLVVPNELLKAHGAVSEAVARSMAEGARAALRSDWAVATTGIAGPSGGSDQKPVGTVWMAVAGPERTVASMEIFPGTRPLVIQRAAMATLTHLWRQIKSAG